MPDKALYSISSVSSMTGVNPVTLRAWERRYGLIEPTRTESGHRLYSGADVERIKRVLQLLDEGVSISRAREALRQAADQKPAPAVEELAPWRGFQQGMLQAVSDFNEAQLEHIYNECISLYPVEIVTRQLLLPLLTLLGERWAASETGIAEEHFFSVFMRNKLGARFHHRNTRNTGPVLVAACLPGEQHEFGLLLFALAAHARGYRIILLGTDMPLPPLVNVARRTSSEGVILSGSVVLDPAKLQTELTALCRQTRVPVLVGGHSSSRYRQQIEAAGAIALGNDLVAGIHTLGQYFPAP